MAYVTATNWVSRGDDWRSDAKGTDRICQGWQGTSYGQTKTFMTVMVFDVPDNHYVNSLSFKLTPSGGYGSSVNKPLKIVRPAASAPKTFNQVSEDIRPTTETLLQSTVVNNGTESTITANDAVLAYLAEGYNYIVICNFETETYDADIGDYSRNYINCTGSTVQYTTASRVYTLTINPNGGSMHNGDNVATSSFTTKFCYGVKTYMGNLTSSGSVYTTNAPTRTGYTFSGFSFSGGTGGQNTSGAKYFFNGNDGSGSYGITTQTYIFNGDYAGNVTATAGWTANTYTVQYNGNGSTGGSTASSTHTYGTAKKLTANGFTRAYTVTYNANSGTCSTTSNTATYTFSKWNTVAAGTGTSYTNQQSVSNLTSTNGGTVNLYAQWTSGSVTLPTPSRTGYNFNGWYTAASGGTKIGDAGASYTPTAAITLYAQWTLKTYTLTLNKGTGVASFTGAGTYNHGDSAATVATASTGYHLTKYAGTLYDGSGTSEWTGCANQTSHTDTWTMNANRTITAYAAKDTYTISYNANGGSGSMASGTKTYGEDFTLPSNSFTKPSNISASYTITLDGNSGISPAAKTCSRTTTYAFSKWALNSASGTEYAVGAKYTSNAAATFYAKWSSTTSGTVVLGSTTRANSSSVGYKVTYNGNGGTSSVAYQSATNIITYAFTGWNSSKSGTGTAYNSTYSYGFNADTTLYAQWSSTTTKGSITLPAAGECSRTGYTCIGWATSSSATTPDYDPAETITPESNITLYAVWQPNTYTVTYNSNDGIGTMTNSTATYNAAFRTRQNAFTREGYRFNGWNEAADGSGVAWSLTSDGVYEAGKDWTWTYTKDITLYAQWTYDIRTLTVDPNGGTWNNTTDVTTISQNYGTTYIVTDPLYIGNTFAGWVLTGGGTLNGTTYTFGAENGTLTATWGENNYTVIFSANGGTGSMDSMSCVFGTSYTLPDNTFSRSGYAFLGWSTSKNATSATYEDGATVSNLATSGTITLYAVWEGYDYSVMYHSNDGTDNATISAHKVGTVSQLANLTFTREGYVFLGWATSTSGAPIYANGALAPADLVTVNDETINLYAIWSEKSPWTLCSVGFFAPTSATNSTLKWWTI